ncbi:MULTISPECIES: DUF6448 family protein [unclassified Anaeromyxobacter]|uniref:DUF6448 family protein n=1 Tax=unclassified Anaeromyxobacter TaxID=2620896 RepID=UPI001F56567D|nr:MULTISPECIES: DUF6448 family protein [unclassified Anaeromyxobacter]
MKTMLLLPLALSALLSPALAHAHCDTLDGPVVVAARSALESGQLNPVLAWVPASGEAEIREAFAKTRAARKTGKEAREVADRWFFETVVRVHRASEGAPYTGLKPAGEVEPAVAVVDQAIAKGDPRAIDAFLRDSVHGGLEARWRRLAAEKPPADDVAAGRRWVAAYVPFVHWVEGVQAAAAGPGAHGHAGAPEAAHAPEQARREPARGTDARHVH